MVGSSGEVLQPDRPADREIAAAAGDPHAAQQQGVPPQHGAPVERTEANAESRHVHRAVPDRDRASETRPFPGAVHLRVHGQPALHPTEGGGERLQDAEVHAVRVRTDLERTLHLSPLHAGEAEVQREVRLDLRDVLPGAPEVQVGVEPPVRVVQDAEHEGGAEAAEAAFAEPHGAAEGGLARGAPDVEAQPQLSIYAGRVPLQQAVQVAQLQPEHLQRHRARPLRGETPAQAHQAGAVQRLEAHGRHGGRARDGEQGRLEQAVLVGRQRGVQGVERDLVHAVAHSPGAGRVHPRRGSRARPHAPGERVQIAPHGETVTAEGPAPCHDRVGHRGGGEPGPPPAGPAEVPHQARRAILLKLESRDREVASGVERVEAPAQPHGAARRAPEWHELGRCVPPLAGHREEERVEPDQAVRHQGEGHLPGVRRRPAQRA
jgi:hypothetical protein